MAQTVRSANPEDIPRLVELLLLDARERCAVNQALWKLASDAPAQIERALAFSLTADHQPVRQFWLVSEEDGRITGVVHAMMLDVPPIYAGPKGKPGLILPDCIAAPDAADGTVGILIDAIEETLRNEGAQILIASFVAGEDWRDGYQRRNYEPLTLYLSRSGFGERGMPSGIRPATDADIAGIVSRSAENRSVLFKIDPFWEIHPEADQRFSAWMTRSLTLRDRDMLVAGSPDDLNGYVIAQPASRMHFPPAHDIGGIGVVDDYYHRELNDPARLPSGTNGATALLAAAEAALTDRGMGTAFVVCPVGWRSKVEMLENAGYETAMVWSIKRSP